MCSWTASWRPITGFRSMASVLSAKWANDWNQEFGCYCCRQTRAGDRRKRLLTSSSMAAAVTLVFFLFDGFEHGVDRRRRVILARTAEHDHRQVDVARNREE